MGPCGLIDSSQLVRYHCQLPDNGGTDVCRRSDRLCPGPGAGSHPGRRWGRSTCRPPGAQNPAVNTTVEGAPRHDLQAPGPGPLGATKITRFAGPGTFARIADIRWATTTSRSSAHPSTAARPTGPVPGSARSPSGRRPGHCAPATTSNSVSRRSKRSRSSTPATSPSPRTTSPRPASKSRTTPVEILRGGDRRIVSIGGDHTIALPNLRALHAKHGPVALLHFDAHLDTWDTYFNAPVTHGTIFRRAFEEGLLIEDHSIHVGIRGPIYDQMDLNDDAAWDSGSSGPATWT